MRRILWVLGPLLLVCSALLASSCAPKEQGAGQDQAGAPREGKKLRIAVIPKGSTHEFWKSVKAGAEAAGAELGCEVIFKGPMKEDDRDSQIKVVEDFTAEKVDGIVLAPLDDTALRMPVMNAQQAGIPVLIIDSDLKDVDVVSFVATDNQKGGKMGGERLVEAIGGTGSVIMLRYQEGSASTTFREQGFLDATQGRSSIGLLSVEQYAGPTTESAQKAAENLIARFKNPDGTLQAAGIFCPNESSTFGMLRALQDAGMAGKVKLVGFDASEKLVQGLKAGEIEALVLQDPFRMGNLGVKSMVDKIKGKSVEKRIDTGAVLVTRDNLETPEIQKLITGPKS